MKKKECPSCAMMVDAELDVCPICEYEFAETKSYKKKITFLALFLAAIIIAYFVLFR